MKNKENKQANITEIYNRLSPYVRPYWLRLAIGIVCGIFYGAATFGLLVALRFALGGMTGNHVDFFGGGISALTSADGNMGEVGLRRLILTVAILPVVAVVQGILFFAGKYLVEWVGNRVVTDLRSRMFEHIHALPMQFFSKSRAGDLISRVTSDTGLLTTLVSNVVGEIIREPFTLIGCVAFMVHLNWRLAVVALLLFPLCIVPVMLFGRRVRKASKRGQAGMGDMLSVVQESISGALVVKAFQMEQEEVSRFNVFNRQVFKMLMRQARARSMNEPVMVFLSALGLSGVVIYAYRENILLEDLLVFGAAMVSMYKPVKKLSEIHIRIQRAAPGVERVFEVLDETNTIDDRPDAVQLADAVRTIDFKRVSFAYEEKPVLDKISLKTRAGQCIAFVGSSGAGKTTLINLIPRFFEVSDGSIELNGRDIRDYSVHSLRSQIGVVTQSTMLFNRSVAENIAYGSRGVTREQIEDAARRANAHDFIMEMDAGYDTVIGERGSRLSGGMAQRVAIARALLKNPPVLILDEATSALDTESERLVQGALDELMKDRTVFVIAHRLSTIAHADLIVVLDKGRIIEQGTHNELLAQGGKYTYFYNIQFGGAATGA